MAKFSDELRQNLIAYFLKKYEVSVSEEEAEEYLDSIAGFYLALAKDNKNE
ncbi:MAG: hypothetical protein WCX30_03915 [Candidatus Paceibacterota bacterium]|jgi:hypothetical protein